MLKDKFREDQLSLLTRAKPLITKPLQKISSPYLQELKTY
jgi:hypothetical protein